MAKVSPLQSNFQSGEFSPLLYGRVDADRYRTALSLCKNYFPTIQGGLTRRPGSYFVSETKFSAKQSRLIPFEFSTTQAYQLEFGDEYIRFYKDNGLITLSPLTITGITQANPAVVTSAGHGLSNGDRVIITGVLGMTQVNNREFLVAGVTANTFQLKTVNNVNVNSTGYDAYTSGGTAAEVYEIASPYQDTDVFQLKFTQSADILYLVHPSYAPRKLSRTGHTNWTLTTIDFLNGPYLPLNATTTTLTPSAATGTGVTLTASAVTGINNNTGFQSTDVGRLIRIREGSTWGYVKITGYTSTTVVTVTVIDTLTNTSAKVNWRLGEWSDTTGYPQAVTFHEDRLFFAGATGTPQRLDGSSSGDYENFAPSASDGTISSSNAVSFTLNANDVNVCRWLASDEKGLLVGTVGGEWVVRPSSQSEAISPTNITAKRSTSYGSANIQPIQIGKSVIFAQRAGRKVRELSYFFDVDGFRASDVSILSEHVTESGLTQMTYQKEPQSIAWFTKTDGQMIGMTFERDLDSLKVGWHRHTLGGTSDSAGADTIIESVSVIPAPDATRDELWIITKRYINGATVRLVEYMGKLFQDEDEQKDGYFVDCGLTFDDPKTVSAATQANPVVVTANAHGFSNGDQVIFQDVMGMTELNGPTFTIANVATNTFELQGINGTAYGAYISGGEVRKLVTSLSGLNHLEGETLSLLGDGAVQPNVVVSGGKINLTFPAATIHVGYGYESDAQMLRLEAGAADGTALGKTRRINRIGLLLHRSLGLKIGMNFSALTVLPFRSTSDLMSRAVPLFSGILSETIDADYDFENQFCWRQDQPLPSTILAVMPQLTTQDR